MSSGSRVIMIISSWYFDLVRIILSDEVLVDELITGGELVDDLVEALDRVMLRDLFLTCGWTKMLWGDEA